MVIIPPPAPTKHKVSLGDKDEETEDAAAALSVLGLGFLWG